MKNVKRVLFSIVLICVVFAGFVFAAEKEAKTAGLPEPNNLLLKPKPLVQLAILLDTSNSMDGLINQARTQLWSIVNEFIFAKRNGITPEVQVALFEYGNDRLPSEKGHIRLVLPFTTDLDKVSEELFALKTNGGSEYCGWVIKDAIEKLNWSRNSNDLKVIFIAGNEPFTQGNIAYQASCKSAIEKGIIVNTIHCGSESEGINGKWKDGASLADGRYLNIDQNSKIVYIEAPQDKEIAALNLKLNETYIPYGVEGEKLQERQNAQDHLAYYASKTGAVQRIVAKASSNYRNDGWDLVDAVKNKNVNISDVKTENLPINMQKMTQSQRKNFVDEESKERDKINNQIQQLNQQREKYVAEQLKKQTSDPNTLGSAVIQAIREQASKKNFNFVQQDKQTQIPKEAVR